MAQYSNRPRDLTGIEEGKNLYTRDSVMEYELPELDVFLQESSYQIVKDICIDSGVSSQGKCLVENCEVDHGSISCILNSDADSNSELTEETLDTESSASNGSKGNTEHDCEKEVIKQCGSEDLTMEGEVDFDTRDEISDHSTKKIISKILLPVREAPSKETVFGNFMVSSAAEAIDNQSHPSKTWLKIKSEVEGGSISRYFNSNTASRNSREEFPHSADCQQPPQTQTGECGFNLFSGAIPKSGSVSHRSTSSTASSHSFAFPILSAEWTGSPVRMVKPDKRQLRKRSRWRLCFLCSKF